MEDQKRRSENLANGAHEASNGTPYEEAAKANAETQLGPVAPNMKATRQLPMTAAVPAPDRRAETRAIQAAARERINTLVTALGDPNNQLHLGAVDDLVAIGPAAVPMLNEALNPNHPWLTAYRAAEALGQIGDGRAAGPLLDALRHPNSNVRWSAVRALAVVGDARALLELRRVARDDRGKTSWGEPVAGAAQSALNQMQSQNMLLRGADLIKTAVACVLMLVALIIAWKVVGDLRTELKQIGFGPVDASVVAPAATVAPQSTAAASQLEAPAQPEATAVPAVEATSEITGTVRATGNVRAQPQVGRNNVIGGVTEGDEVLFLTTTPDGQWFRIRLGERHAPGSRINGDTDDGWVNRSLLSPPSGNVPTEEPPPVPTTQAEPAPTAAP
jgi:hypothetical protein